MAELEDSSIDFYSMLRSVVNQKRQAELDEAVQTSGWTAGRTGKFQRSGGTRPDRRLQLAGNGSEDQGAGPCGQHVPRRNN